MNPHHSASKDNIHFFGYKLILVALTISLISLLVCLPGGKVTAKPTTKEYSNPEATTTYYNIFTSDPFGFIGKTYFQPRFTWDNNGNQIENTDFGVKNPDMGTQSTCFNQPWNNIYHAGEDLYFYDRSVTGLTFHVKAIAPGIVVYYVPSDNWPGSAVIIQHSTSDGPIYSVYMHLTRGSVPVSVGDNVMGGDELGTVMRQDYGGAYPQYHQNTDDTHLHFEIRNFLSAANIYPPSYSNCNGTIPGRGYTYPLTPDLFPNSSSYYFHPSVFISQHQNRQFIPVAIIN